MVPLDASDRLLVAVGIDEVGRGPLAGPVVAAGVVLDAARPIDGLNDSKKLSAKEREDLSKLIHERALVVSIASIFCVRPCSPCAMSWQIPPNASMSIAP